MLKSWVGKKVTIKRKPSAISSWKEKERITPYRGKQGGKGKALEMLWRWGREKGREKCKTFSVRHAY